MSFTNLITSMVAMGSQRLMAGLERMRSCGIQITSETDAVEKAIKSL